MLATALMLYFIALLGAMVVTGQSSFSWPVLLGLGVLALIGVAIIRGLGELLGEREEKETEAKDAENKARIPLDMYVPPNVRRYLRDNDVNFVPHTHARAVDAQKVAQAMHISGKRVAKTVVVRADGRVWIAVVPAHEHIDFEELADELRADSVELVAESDFADLFPEAEIGAEPPFGKLYGVPVIVDQDVEQDERMVFRAGSHNGVIEMDYGEYESIENPRVGHFSHTMH